eukprot:TRINITY_DN12164_c0_g2_i1.p1 TRINITY_DN12164_c0_g2~~TRINITY_DN12164_c0_g2_i1.p1  ORF type:complete len:846 (-),score=210.69 TRINITY_DN12164_c0_g2_i1:28-2565(-)
MSESQDNESLMEQVAQLLQEREKWQEEKIRLSEEVETLSEEVETLRGRVKKLALAAGQTDAAQVDAETQTESNGAAADGDATNIEGADGGHGNPTIGQMLQNPHDDAVQLQGIEALFQQQTQAGDQADAAPMLHSSLEVSVAIFRNHQTNWPLLLKASQFVSVLLAEPAAQQKIPAALLQQAAEEVLAASKQVVEKAGGSAAQAGTPSPSKLMTWFLSLLALLLPSLEVWLRAQAKSEAFVQGLMRDLISRLLSLHDAPQETLVLKAVQLLPLLPTEAWIQKACLEGGAIHSFSLAGQRLAEKKGGYPKGSNSQDAQFGKAVRAAVRRMFADNMELCCQALGDTFVSEPTICLEVIDELLGQEAQKRGTFRALDEHFEILGKAMNLWAFHQRKALENPEPEKCSSRALLQKLAKLVQAILGKLPPQQLLKRMEEFEESEVFRRIAVSTVRESAQLRLQIAVNYTTNNVIAVIVSCLQMLLRNYEKSETGGVTTETEQITRTFRLLDDERLPVDAWPYMDSCLDVCLHILSHWSCTNPSGGKEIDPSSAAIQLVHAGLMDALAELTDPTGMGMELREQPPQSLVRKAEEALQRLFERNGPICVFCMKHYVDSKPIITIGCESIANDPFNDNLEMQQEAVTLLSSSFEKFAVKDQRLGRKLLKALTMLFEASYNLVVWFLQQQPIGSLPELQSLDVHIEAVRAISRAGYWSAEDAPLLPDFVAVLAQVLLDAVEGHLDVSAPPSGSGRRVFDLTEAEELAASCTASMLHLMLIDPTPPTVLHCLARSLCKQDSGKKDSALEDADSRTLSGQTSEEAVNAVMKMMQVFPSSDRIQINCQHILTSLLGE